MTQSRFFTFVSLLIGVIFFISAEMLEEQACGSNAYLEKTPSQTNSDKMSVDFANIPLYFIANEGQVDERAKFYAKTSGYTLWITNGGLVFDSVRMSNEGESHTKFDENIQVTRNVTRLFFVNTKENPKICPLDETALKVNYFIGKDPSKWHCDVPTSKAVLYKEIYAGIDLKVYGVEKQIEYDWIVAPGKDPGIIAFTYDGTQGTRINDDGDLLIETGSGQLLHKRPVSYQQIGDRRVAVEVDYRKTGGNTYGFVVGAYDKRHALIIDPLVLTYSTYLGGGNHNKGHGIAVDNNGNVYVTGETDSTGFPLKNQYQTFQGSNDAFVTKINTGSSGEASLVYSTYLGGGNHDKGHGIAVDNSGNVYVTGETNSADFPIKNQYQTYQGMQDAFVTKINTGSSGEASLVYSTYLGGGSHDWGYDIAVDNSGNVYVTGATLSSDFPKKNQYKEYQAGVDAFVTKIDPASGESGLIYSTYLGGGSQDWGHGIAVDNSGNVYVTGETDSTSFPIKNEYQTFQGSYDAFVTRINTCLTDKFSLIYSTYLGGEQDDNGNGIAVDNSGNAYVTGKTGSTDFPTRNQYQTYQGDVDAFVTKINTGWSSVSSLLYSTYLGGEGEDNGNGIAVDNSGNAYVIGKTASTDFPTRNQYQTYQGGSVYSFVTKISPTSSGAPGLIYSTYLGGGIDYGNDIAVDSSLIAYVTGYTESSYFPTKNQYQTFQGSNDTFVFRLEYIPVLFVNKADGTCGGNSPCYTSIQSAINDAATESQLWVTSGSYNEHPALNAEKALTIRGSWNASYDAQTDNPTFIKSPSAPQGSMTLQELTIEP